MTTITGITSQPKQNLAVVLEDGSQVSIYLEYRLQQKGWFANMAWGDDWIVNGMRLVSGPNLLHHWFKLIPFGLALNTDGDADPYNVEDFATGRSVLTLLNADDVLQVNSAAFAGP